MSISTKLTQKINYFIVNINSMIDDLIRKSLSQNALPVLANLNSQVDQKSGNFDIKSIMEEGFVWCPTPKKRTTAEWKLTKKFLPFPNNFITKYCTPKTNIIECLDCGSYHEKGTLCGKCYQQVKKETDEIQNQMLKNDDFKYNYPTKEIALVYEGEQETKEMYEKEKRVIVEMPKKRPSWFNDNLMTKINTK